MVLWWNNVFAIFHTVKLKTYWRNNTNYTIYSKLHWALSNSISKGLNYIQIDFYEQAKHIQGPHTNFTFSPCPLNTVKKEKKIFLICKEIQKG